MEHQSYMPVGANKLDRFEILENIGGGGFADVFKARRRDDNLIVALKCPKLTGFQTAPNLFLKEAEKWKRLRHPNIVQLVEYGEKPIPYIAMEFMPGGSLRPKIGALIVPQVLTIAEEVADALLFANNRGLAHLDVKPDNILLDAAGKAKLSDWGLSRVALETSGGVISYLGTAYYSAPEQADHKRGDQDLQTDIWQFGVTFYEIVSGKLPFPADFITDLIHKILNEEPSLLSEIRPDLNIPPDFEKLIAGCLKKNRHERFESFFPIRETLRTLCRSKPIAAFEASTLSGEAPLSVSFHNKSAGQVTTWRWEFGDGETSSESNPTHQFTKAGSYKVTLKATGANGTDSYTLKEPVQVLPTAKPVAYFDASPLMGQVPLLVGFRDKSKGPITSWQWDFNDGERSNEQNPTHQFKTASTYKVSLKVTGPGGSDIYVIKEPIKVFIPKKPVADYEASPLTGEVPLLVKFTDRSEGEISAYQWDFGDGEASTEPGPSHEFKTPGTYRVTLKVSGPGGSDFYARRERIEVRPRPRPNAFFEASPVSDYAPLRVKFEDRSTGPIASWRWDFDDGETSTEASPVHVFKEPGSYRVILTVGGPGGSDIHAIPEHIQARSRPPAPIAAFEASPLSGYAPLQVNFRDQSSGHVTSWEWDFGDGVKSREQHLSHTFEKAGNYNVTLTVTGDGGTDTATILDPVQAQPRPPKPVAKFSAFPVKGYAPMEVDFTNNSSGQIDSWEWDFGDGQKSNERDPAHSFSQPGNYNVSLKVTGPGGIDTFSITDAIRAGPRPPKPMAGFTLSPLSQYVPLKVGFDDKSTGQIDSWQWDFGDGETSQDRNPTHVYQEPGNYTVKLQVTGPGGADAFAFKEPVHAVPRPPPPKAGFVPSVFSGYVPLEVTFQDNSTGEITSREWDFDDGQRSNEVHPTHIFDKPGYYRVGLKVTGPGGADIYNLWDPTIHTELAPPRPTAGFTPSLLSGYLPLEVDFLDSSTGEIASREWDFGDGEKSNEPRPAHVFQQAGDYKVTLKVTGPGGTHSYTLEKGIQARVRPAKPVAAFSVSPLSGGVPLKVTFTDKSTAEISSREWAFGDGERSSEANPTHVYEQPAMYVATLKVGGPGGADTTSTREHIQALPPKTVPSFDASPPAGEAPLPVHFRDKSTGRVTRWEWDFGDGERSSEQHPVHTYNEAGSYKVSLKVTGPYGSDAYSLEVKAFAVKPTAYCEFTPQSGTAPLEVSFQDRSKGHITSWEWSFGDGKRSAEPNPSHFYQQPGDYWVTLKVGGPAGSDTYQALRCVKALPTKPVAAIDASTASGKVPLMVNFLDRSSGHISAWDWDFGDGERSNIQSPQHTFQRPGNYTVTLKVTGPAGSDTGTLREPVRVEAVLPPPPVASFAASTTSGAAPLEVKFKDRSEGQISAWEWDFGDGEKSLEQNPSHLYSKVGEYRVTLMVEGPGGRDHFSLPEPVGVTLAVTHPAPAPEAALSAPPAGAPLAGARPAVASPGGASSTVAPETSAPTPTAAVPATPVVTKPEARPGMAVPPSLPVPPKKPPQPRRKLFLALGGGVLALAGVVVFLLGKGPDGNGPTPTPAPTVVVKPTVAPTIPVTPKPTTVPPTRPPTVPPTKPPPPVQPPTVNVKIQAVVNGLRVTVIDAAAPANAIRLIDFDWGDGEQSSGRFPETHTYSRPGTYVITATAYNDAGSGSTTITVRVVPTPVVPKPTTPPPPPPPKPVTPKPIPGPPTTPPPQPRPVTPLPPRAIAMVKAVPANKEWGGTTDIFLSAGQRFDITAAGSWESDMFLGGGVRPGQQPPRQQTDANGTGLRPGGSLVAPQAVEYSLVAKIGDSEPFYVGTSYSGTAPVAGTLVLSMNDRSGKFNDNTGAITVKITVYQ